MNAAEEEAEARRIAGELGRLREDGAITSPEDARFYATFLVLFRGSYVGKKRDKSGDPVKKTKPCP